MGLLYLDLEEQQQVLALSPLAGRSRWAAFGFRETDYLPHATRQGTALIDAVRQLLVDALGQAPTGRVCLLTQPRSWGLAFNPVSFFTVTTLTALWPQWSVKSAIRLGANAITMSYR